MNLAQRINGWTRKVPAWLIYLVAVIPPVWYFSLAFSGNLPGDPVKIIEREIGELGLKLLIAVLLITPLREVTGVSLIKFRRALGVTAFFYILLHFTVWAVLDVQSFGGAVTAILKYPYIIVGMVALVLMIPLALTSNNWSIRKLSPARWKWLHKLTYPVVILGGVHYYLLSKAAFEPLVYLGIILVLLAMRLKIRRFLAPIRG
jgi:methionine sulfoxide reductase heme-binding subunit